MDNNNKKSNNAGCGFAGLFIPIFIALTFLGTLDWFEFGDWSGPAVVAMVIFASIIIGGIALVVRAVKKSNAAAQSEGYQRQGQYMPPRDGSRPAQGYQNSAYTAMRQPTAPRAQGYQNSAYTAMRQPGASPAAQQAGHLCDDPYDHAVREDNVDMMKTIHQYSLEQLDRKRFERPLSEEERQRSADSIRELYKSGIIGLEEYQYKLEELRRR